MRLFRRRAAWRATVMEQQRGRHEKNHPGGHGGIGRPSPCWRRRGRADKPLTLGVSVGLGNVAMEIAVREARAQGLDVKLVEFPTYISQNEGVGRLAGRELLPAPAFWKA